ncbi:hypothetical protein PInf_006943 [Phytophthora infestans]|nr:hypothetical protein PInf_006943 [Phytophthora infestans]
MPPPPRRGSGKSRGRGGRGSDRYRSSSHRNGSESSNAKPKKRERGSSGNKRGGGRGGGGSSTSSSSSAATSARPARAITMVLKKLVVRNIPPTASEQEARELMQAHGVKNELIWRFVPGRQRSNNRPPTPARLYVDMKKEPERARKLIASLHGQFFYPDTKDKEGTKPLDVEFAPFQKIPREKQRKDVKVGTIDCDPEYLAFLEELAKPKDKLPSAEALVDMAEGETLEKPVAALVKYLNERKSHNRDKCRGKSGGKSADKNGHRVKGKKDGSKPKAAKDKVKSSKDRQKKGTGDAARAQVFLDPKSRKPRGRSSSKKESTKPDSLLKAEPNQPGVLCIMTPKSASTANDSIPAPAAKANGTSPSLDTSLARGSEKCGSKGGKKNAGRGRNNPKKGKDGGDGADGEGFTKADSKPSHSRGKGENAGKKESINKGEREKHTVEENAVNGPTHTHKQVAVGRSVADTSMADRGVNATGFDARYMTGMVSLTAIGMQARGDPAIKLVLLGNGSVGKSSLIARFVDDGFARVYKQTIGLDFFEKKLQLPRDQRIVLQVWDIGGQTINSKMLSKYLFGVHVALLCYDVTDAQSFSDVEDWLRVANENGSKQMNLHLVGNKTDLVAHRVVSNEKHEAFIRQHKLLGGFLVSAQSGDNVLKTVYRISAAAANICVSEFELSFCDKVVRAVIPDASNGKQGEQEARTAMADEIEAEDIANEALKSRKTRPCCLLM